MRSRLGPSEVVGGLDVPNTGSGSGLGLCRRLVSFLFVGLGREIGWDDGREAEAGCLGDGGYGNESGRTGSQNTAGPSVTTDQETKEHESADDEDVGDDFVPERTGIMGKGVQMGHPLALEEGGVIGGGIELGDFLVELAEIDIVAAPSAF